MNNNKNKENCELVWANLFISHINKKYGLDYKGVSVPGTKSGIDVEAFSDDKKYPNLKLELTRSIERDKTVDFLLFDEDRVKESITKKIEKYKHKDMSDTILIIQGLLSKKWVEDEFNKEWKNQFATLPFKGIYYVSFETSNNESFVEIIKPCFKVIKNKI